MTTAELRADDLTVALSGRRVLDGVSLVVRSGQSTALTGPSGCGKTALLLALAGLVPAVSGRVLLDGSPLGTDDARWDRHGVILQGQGLAPELTAEENVAIPLQSRGLGRATIASLSAAALDSVGLGGSADRLVEELSGGQRQRVGVARALAGAPEVLLADEPTSELDPENRSRVLSLLVGRTAGRIVVVASNDPEVTGACHHVLHLRDGTLVD